MRTHIKSMSAVTLLTLSISTNSATTETNNGVSKIEGTCDKTTYLSLCHGENCEFGSSNATLKKGEFWEAHVNVKSKYCKSCENTPDLSICDKEYIPLDRTTL
ncbi:hypothetical protein L2778_000837 [Vibrio vulnificus]|nr:hypothetical protein [Vibrio vulnificus]